MPWSHFFILILFLFVATILGGGYFETFETQPSWDIISTNPLQFSSWALSKQWKLRALKYNPSTWRSQADMLKTRSFVSKITGNDAVAVLVDPYDASSIWKVHRRIATAPKGYFVILLDVAKAIQVECSYDFLGKRVGFLDRSDELFLRALIKAYRMPSNSVTMEHISVENWDNLSKELERLDAIVCYVIPGSPFHKLLQTQDLSVMGFKNLDIDRIRLFHPFIQKEDVELRKVLLDVPGSALKIMHRANDTTLPFMSMIAVDTRPDVETFVSRIEIDEESIDPSYRCFGDTSITSKTLCESPFDASGLPKRKQTIWDRPCSQNSDCPFYKANKNYRNTRGGCNKDGFCEFPVGIKRIAYTKYDDQGMHAPFCYQCSDPSDPSCCKNQQHAWDLVSPDYAFPNDTSARKTAGLSKITVDTL